jgi:hypothetical protein
LVDSTKGIGNLGLGFIFPVPNNPFPIVFSSKRFTGILFNPTILLLALAI